MEHIKDTLSPELQEILDKVFPAYEQGGIRKETMDNMLQHAQIDSYKSAVEFASQFDSTLATRQDWFRLDWALSIPALSEEHPAVAELFPELVTELQLYHTLMISHKDMGAVVEKIISWSVSIAKNPENAESVVSTVEESLSKTLGEELAFGIKCLLEKEMCRQCRAAGLPVDKELMERYFCTFQA